MYNFFMKFIYTFVFFILFFQSSIFSEQTTSSLSELLLSADTLWLEKHHPDSFDKAIELYEEIYAISSKNRTVLERLSFAYSLKGYYFAVSKQEQLFLLEESLDYLEQCLDLNTEYVSIKNKDLSFDEELATLGSNDLFCLLFKAQTRGQWAKVRGIGQSLKYVGALRAMISRVESIDSTFYHGAVPRYWGAFYANLPTFMGGSDEKAKDYFQKAINIAPYYLSSYRLFLEDYAIPKRDELLFDQLTSTVLSFDLSTVDKNILFSSQLEQEKVKVIAEQKGRYFK